VIRFRVTFMCWLDASISMANPGDVFSRIHGADERSIYHKFWFYKLKSQQRGNRSNLFLIALLRTFVLIPATAC
jgi:hypothetical protein